MDDLIFRQAAIEAVRWLYIDYPKINNDFAYNMAIDQADSRLKDLPPAQRWIPVTEKLPDDAGTYIICDCYGNVMSRHFCKKADGFAGYWHANGSKYYGNPTHWMPLPEPPKEEP